MPVLYCKHCIWGIISKNPDQEGIKCTNPELGNVQKGNVMPMRARSCPLHKPAERKNKQNF